MMFRTSALAFVLTMAAVVASGPLAAQDAAPAKKNPFRGKVALIAGFAEGSEKGASMKKFAAAYSESHASTFVFASKERPGAERFRVLDPSGAVVYEGGDDKEAEVAVVNTLTDMPVPGQLINGVALKKFKNLQKSFVMGKVRAEGSGLAPFKAALKSKKTGAIVCKATVTRSDNQTLDCKFEGVAVEPGEYVFVIQTRSGLGEDFGVATATRNIKVVA